LRKVELTMNEQTKYEIVKQFIDNKSTNYKSLSVKLCSSLKTAYNLVKKYKDQGTIFEDKPKDDREAIFI